MRTDETIAIGWIDPGQVDGGFACSIAMLVWNQPQRFVSMHRAVGSLLSMQRNSLATMFLNDEKHPDWLLLIDSDERFNMADVTKLVDAADAEDAPIIAGMYARIINAGNGQPAISSQIYRLQDNGIRFETLNDYPADTLINVDGAGTGALLIHRTVFETIRDNAPDDERDWCWFRDMPWHGDWLGEDLYFCLQARTCGYQIKAHTGATFEHHKQLWFTAQGSASMK